MAIVLCRRLTQGALHARWLTDWMNAILGDALSTFIISTQCVAAGRGLLACIQCHCSGRLNASAPRKWNALKSTNLIIIAINNRVLMCAMDERQCGDELNRRQCKNRGCRSSTNKQTDGAGDFMEVTCLLTNQPHEGGFSIMLPCLMELGYRRWSSYTGSDGNRPRPLSKTKDRLSNIVKFA